MGLTALHGAANRGSDEIIKLSRPAGRQGRREGCRGTHAVDVGGRRLPRHASRTSKTNLDRVTQTAGIDVIVCTRARETMKHRKRTLFGVLPLATFMWVAALAFVWGDTEPLNAQPPQARTAGGGDGLPGRDISHAVLHRLPQPAREDCRADARYARPFEGRTRRRDVGEGHQEDPHRHDAAERRTPTRAHGARWVRGQPRATPRQSG